MSESQVINSPTVPPPAKPRILVVDDQPINIRVLLQILSKDYEVFMATSGEQALQFCHQHLPDLVLLDVVMPDMDGLEVCRRLKADPITLEIPVIFVTANSKPEDENNCWDVGAVDFVNKPVNPATLLNRVKSQITLKQQSDHLRKLAYFDGLTGLANKRMLSDYLSSHWKHCLRNKQNFSVILIDIDHFKAFNDHYGHLTGDECLRNVAQAIKSACLRPIDLAARFGGEEFCCLLPETDLEGAKNIATRIMRNVALLDIPHATSPTTDKVSISAGICTLLCTTEHQPDDLLKLADEQLYQAKASGRNKYCSATTEQN